MTRVYEERSSYDASKDAVGVITLALECAPGQIVALKDELASIRDRAGVYAVDIDHDVRAPETPAPMEVEAHDESPVQPVAEDQPVDTSDEQPELAGAAGEAEPGPVGGSAEVQVHDETSGDVIGDIAETADSGAREGTGEDTSIVPQGE